MLLADDATPAPVPGAFQAVHEWHLAQKNFDLAIAPSDFVYVATDEGLLRFDGQRAVRLFPQTDEGTRIVGQIDALAVASDRGNDVIWAALRGGDIVAIRDRRARVAVSATATEHKLITCLLVDAAGDLWIGTLGGLWRLHDGQLERLPVQEPVTALVAQGSHVWVGTRTGLLRADRGKLEPVAASSITNVVKLSVGSVPGTLWIFDARRGLMKVHHAPGDAHAEVVTPRSSQGEPPLSLAPASDGGVWVSYRDRCERIAELGGAVVETAPCEDSTAMADESGRGFWAADPWGDVSRLVRPQVRGLPVNEGGRSSLAFAVLTDPQGTLWATTIPGILRVDAAGPTLLASGQTSPIWCPRSLAARRAGGIWVATCEHGLWLQDKGTANQVPLPAPPVGSKRLAGVFEASNGGLWASALDGALYHKRDGAFATIDLGPSRCDFSTGLDLFECSSAVVSFAETPDGAMWFGTRSAGLYRYDERGAVAMGPEDGLAGLRIIALHADQEGRLWVGGAGSGLHVLSGGRFFKVSSTHAPVSVFGIVDDPAGWLWVSHDKGVSRVRLHQMVEHATSGKHEPAWISYGQDPGLASVRLTQEHAPSIARLPNGGVAVPTIRGLKLIAPPAQMPIVRPGLPRVESVSVDGLRDNAEEAIELGFTRTHAKAVAIAFAVPFAGMADNLRVRYRLNGSGADWREDDGSFVGVFHSVPAGRHTFQLQAFVSGHEQDAITISKPLRLVGFFQRPAAWLVMALPLVPLALLFLWLRERLLKGRIEAVANERASIARDVHDTIAQYFATLSLQLERLRDDATDGDGKTTLSRIDETGELVERCRMEVRHVIRGLRRAELPSQTSLLADLQDLVTQLQVLNLVEIDLQVKGNQDQQRELSADEKQQLGRLVQESITNAIAHGKADNITVIVTWGDNLLSVSVEDDGVGFEPDRKSPDSLLHFGLQGMRERAAKLGADLTINSQPGQGTSVTVALRRGKRITL